MARDIEFNPEDMCHFCGETGAFDFLGDKACPDCAKAIFEDLEWEDMAAVKPKRKGARQVRITNRRKANPSDSTGY